MDSYAGIVISLALTDLLALWRTACTAWERAGEKSVALGLAYDFSDLICEGLRMQVAYGLGRDAVDPETGLSLQDRDELDLNIEYRPTYGPLENVRFQLDYSRVVFHGGGSPRRTDPQLVAIFTYLVPLL